MVSDDVDVSQCERPLKGKHRVRNLRDSGCVGTPEREAVDARGTAARHDCHPDPLRIDLVELTRDGEDGSSDAISPSSTSATIATRRGFIFPTIRRLSLSLRAVKAIVTTLRENRSDAGAGQR